MKICYICLDPGIPVFGRKGCSTHVRETCRALKAAGHEVFLVTANKGEDRCDFGDIPVYNAPVCTSTKLGSDLRLFINNFKAMSVLKKAFAKEKPDVIYERHSLYNLAGTWIAEKYHLPRILESNTFLVIEQKDRIHFPFIASRIEQYILKKAPHIVVVSPPLKSAYVNMGIPADKISIMPMAVDVDTFHPGINGERVTEKFNIKDKTVVGYVGTLTGWHGINYIIECGKILKELNKSVVFFIVGGVDKKIEKYNEELKQYNLENVIFAGSVPYKDIPEYIAAMDITFVPNSTQWASPTKIFEYQAMAKSIVAPSLIPVREIIDEGKEGLLFEPTNVKEMVEKILFLHNNPQLRNEMGEAGRKRVVASHSWQVNTQNIIEVFKKMMKR